MASARLQDELNCSVCLSIYTDPVTLRCGHNFCRECIDRVLDTQERSRVYFCPDCREEFQQRPVLHRSIALRNIADHFHSTQSEWTGTGIFCTYCTQSSVPAVKSCRLCNVSLCHKHLMVHSKSEEHVLTDPTSPPENRTCPIHKKSLEYYCTKDKTCICVICSSAKDHKGHPIEVPDRASGKKKERLRGLLNKLSSDRDVTEKRLQSLQKHKREVHKRAAGEMERVTALFRDIRKKLENLEKKVLGDISLWEGQASLSSLNLIQKLEMKMDGFYSKIVYIEEVCNMTDPVTILQEQESERKDFCPAEDEDRKRQDKMVLDVGDLDGGLISDTVHRGLSHILKGVGRSLIMEVPTDILLDVNTAGNYIHIADDLKIATHIQINQNRPETQQRFQCNQVLSTKGFASGKHCWEVEISKSGNLRVGMCYPSVERGGYQACIGDNRKSWCLCRWYYNNKDQYSVMHDSKVIQSPHKFNSQKLRISLDYEAGQMSFYELGDPIKHLYTFTATFTEPLHAALCIWKDGFVKISG